jgi:hypothetical protein
VARYRDNLGALCVMQRHLEEAEERLLALIAGKPTGSLTDDEEDCPDLSDPNAPAEVYLCQLGARIEYLIGLIDCAEYKVRVAACVIS